MKILHMETNAVRTMADQISRSVDNITEQFAAVLNSVNRMEWQGHNQEELVGEIKRIDSNLEEKLAEGLVLARRINLEVTEWEEVTSGLNGTQNKTIPTPGSLTGVTDERPPWMQWLGNNTPLAFIPGFTPPAGGDSITVDDRLDQKFGRDVNLVDGSAKWEDYEISAVDQATEKFPDILARQSQIRNIYRDNKASGASSTSSPLGVWVPKGYMGPPDYRENEAIYMYRPIIVSRQGDESAVNRFETVVFHEMVHSAQYTKNGELTDLTSNYLNKFGWTYEGDHWHFSGKDSEFPGDGDNHWLWGDMSYPKPGRNGMEDMAEAVTYYQYEPETLMRNSPERYEWVKQNIFEGKEFK